MARSPKIHVAISAMPAATDRAILAEVAATGRRVWLPRAHVDCVPGYVYIPEWLYRKMRSDFV